MKLSLGFERRVFQVSELNSAIQGLFETEFRGIWVAGEISGCRAASSGHYYFCLKDAQSQLKCALFKTAARLARFKPRDGLAVIARGNLEVYEARGEYQLIIELLQPQGAGALQLAFEQLKKKLSAEGLFEQARKRALPKLPRRVGIVTSLSGAVLHDMLQILERRFPGIHVRIFPAQVQGEGAVEQVCRALKYFSERAWAEVVILARGGGSLEDLWTFNEEAVARMIVASKVPIVSAIGHETDFTIADFAADHRAPTPSAAAEIVICTRASLLEQIAAHRAKAAQSIRYRVLTCSRDLQHRGTARAATLLHRAVAKRAQALDDLEFRLRTTQRRLIQVLAGRLGASVRRLQAGDLRLCLARNRHRQELLAGQMAKSMETRISRGRRRHETVHARLAQLSPLAVLARGYAIVENAERHILRSAAEASSGEELRVRLHRGELSALVSEIRPAE
ncbi:MAG: exodeoxyribonuclease VII large subunit [Acidobacteriaceae bacterium]|nr:exodeoxyribonuclease VII large subunit [Acidobacteriaceae bacterium]MBV9778419.1 exodeoxyribonuclease VII large subunit [Acidobacteriaceae bacterium]